MTILRWALLFFLISIVAGVLGFTAISAATADFARFLFYVFVVIFLVLLILGLTILRVGGGKGGALDSARHARACSGHPTSPSRKKDVDGRETSSAKTRGAC